jgi:succinate dehydrogenase/fumarate reductase flavoprotein subunit
MLHKNGTIRIHKLSEPGAEPDLLTTPPAERLGMMWQLALDGGVDRDFGKPVLQYKIQTRPFYAAWATPLVYDTRTGLRISAQGQGMDMQGQMIPGLYCGGESAGGFNQHGLGRCTTQGYIAGKNAAAERPQA